MKRLFWKSFLGGALSIFVAACTAGGRIEDPSLASDDDSGSSLVSFTDPSGASITGGVIDPNGYIIVNFVSSVKSVLAAMICNDVPQDIVVMPISDTQVQILPTSGKFPQKTSCTLSVTTSDDMSLASLSSINKAIFTESFEVGCDTDDDFTNSATLDLSSGSFSAGTGCWKPNLSNVSADSYDIVSDLEIVVPSSLGLDDKDLSYMPAAVKRISGDATISLGINDITYILPSSSCDPDCPHVGFAYGLMVSQDFPGMISLYLAGPISDEDTPPMFVIIAMADYEEHSTPTYVCMGGIFRDEASYYEVNCSGGAAPQIGFVRKGNIFTPRYSLDGGVSWSNGMASVDMSAYFDAAAPIDVAITVVPMEEELEYSSVHFNSFVVTGDATLVP